MAYYTDLTTSYDELKAYEVSLEHFRALSDLSYEMLNDLYEKRNNSRDLVISLQSYSTVLSHLSKSVNKYHPQIPYLEVPSLESMSIEDSLSLEGFKDFIRSVWEKIVAFFRALWEFITRAFGKSSEQEIMKVMDAIEKDLEKIDQLVEEDKKSILDLVSEKFKVITPLIANSRNINPGDTINFEEYVDFIGVAISCSDRIIRFNSNYSNFVKDLTYKIEILVNNIESDTLSLFLDKDIGLLLDKYIEGKERIEYLNLIYWFNDKIQELFYSKFEELKKDSSIIELEPNQLDKELRIYYEKNILNKPGIVKGSAKIYKALNLDDINRYYTIYLIEYLKERMAIPTHEFINLNKLDENGNIINMSNLENIEPVNVTVSGDFEKFREQTNKLKYKIINTGTNILNSKTDYINPIVNKTISKNEYEKTLTKAENAAKNMFYTLKEVVKTTIDDRIISIYENLFGPVGQDSVNEKNYQLFTENFKKVVFDSICQCLYNNINLAKLLLNDLVMLVEVFKKEEKNLEDILDYAYNEIRAQFKKLRSSHF